MSKKRIFIAIPVSHRLQDEILAWREDFQNLPVRWLLGKNLHITVIPPWHESDVETVARNLKTINIKSAPFEIQFTKVTYGPNQYSPRLIWAEGGASVEIAALKKLLEKVLSRKPERRNFLLHLTLARFRPENFPQFSVKKLDEKISWRDTVGSFAIMESHLSSRGADYEILETISL